jgi:hypothetical protein
MKQLRKPAVALFLSLTLVIAGFAAPTPEQHAIQPHQTVDIPGCGVVCGWLVGKVLDYALDYLSKTPCSQGANTCGNAPGPVGGGGGDAFPAAGAPDGTGGQTYGN